MYVYTILKIILIISFNYIFYIKLSGWKVSKLKILITGLFFISVFSVIMRIMMCFLSEPFNSILIVLLSSAFFSIMRKERYENSFINTAIAFAASHLLYLISTAIALIILIMFFKFDFNDYRTALLTGAIEILLTVFIMKMKIEISMTQKKYINSIGFSLSGIIVVFYILFREDGMTHKSLWLIFSGIILCAVGLIYWLKRETIFKFNDKVKELINLRLNNENEFLNNTLNYLETRLHREDKRLPAYQKAVEEILNCVSDEAVKLRAVKILEGIKTARMELSHEQLRELKNYKNIPSTGIAFFDSLVAYMFDIATQKNIDCDMVISGDLTGIKDIITQTQLETLVADLIQNAITAVEYSNLAYKSIVVNFQQAGGIYEFSIKDNGIPFENDTLINLGKRRITTHTDTGGSGIGFMTTFDIMRSCGASLIITENELYKNVAIRFDGKGRYVIRSHRAEHMGDKEL